MKGLWGGACVHYLYEDLLQGTQKQSSCKNDSVNQALTLFLIVLV